MEPPVTSLQRASARLLPGWVDGGARDDRSLLGVARSLRRYQLLAWTVGVGLLVLVAVGMPLQYAGVTSAVVRIVGPLHGVIYMVYLVAAFDLARRSRFSLPQMVLMLCAGFLPVLAFVIERRVAHRVEGALDDARRRVAEPA